MPACDARPAQCRWGGHQRQQEALIGDFSHVTALRRCPLTALPADTADSGGDEGFWPAWFADPSTRMCGKLLGSQAKANSNRSIDIPCKDEQGEQLGPRELLGAPFLPLGAPCLPPNRCMPAQPAYLPQGSAQSLAAPAGNIDLASSSKYFVIFAVDAAGTKNVARWSSMYLMLGLSPPRQATPIPLKLQMSGPTLSARGMPCSSLPTCADSAPVPTKVQDHRHQRFQTSTLHLHPVQPAAPAIPSAALPASASSAAAASAAALALAAPALPTTTLALATAALATSPQPPAALSFAATALAVPATSAAATALLGKQG